MSNDLFDDSIECEERGREGDDDATQDEHVLERVLAVVLQEHRVTLSVDLIATSRSGVGAQASAAKPLPA
jgi:hypothetical protein